MGDQDLKLNYRDKDGKRYIEMPDEVDIYSHIEVKNCVISIMKETESDIVLDMRKMKRIESSGISVIIILQKLIEDDNRKLFLTNMNDFVREVMECTRVPFSEI